MRPLENIFYSFLTLAAFGIICLIIQKLSPSETSQKYWRRETKLDFFYWLFSNFLNIYFVLFFISLFISLIALFHPAIMDRINSAGDEKVKALGVAFAVILLDFVSYWIHRIFHSSKFWKYHAIHHSSREIDWLSAVRFHPLESIIILAITYSICVVFGMGLKTVAAAIAIRGVYGYIVHSNVTWHYGWLGYIIASPYFHRWHHTQDAEALDKNFGGVFSAWDYLFGTAYLPEDRRQPKNFGVSDNTGESFWQHLLYPFRKDRN